MLQVLRKWYWDYVIAPSKAKEAHRKKKGAKPEDEAALLQQYREKFSWNFYPHFWLSFYLYGKAACFKEPLFNDRMLPHLITSDAFLCLKNTIDNSQRNEVVSKLGAASRHLTARVNKAAKGDTESEADTSVTAAGTSEIPKTYNLVRSNAAPSKIEILDKWGDVTQAQLKFTQAGVLPGDAAEMQRLSEELKNIMVSIA